MSSFLWTFPSLWLSKSLTEHRNHGYNQLQRGPARVQAYSSCPVKLGVKLSRGAIGSVVTRGMAERGWECGGQCSPVTEGQIYLRP